MNQHRLKGVVSIEFAMGFFLFILMFFVWAQMAYAGYISGLIDYTLAETARDTRASVPSQKSKEEAQASQGDANAKAQTAYQIQFKAFLKQEAGIWANFIDFSKFHTKVYYYDSIAKLADSCQLPKDDDSSSGSTSGGSDSSGSAQGSGSNNGSDSSEEQKNCLENGATQSETNAPIAVYQASYDFKPLLNLIPSQNLSLKREVFVVQEYERTDFYN
ncbi:TadE/TadG family type IV pilus assembly protein [Celerinatantimonas diazotrophica]|uniref:TadE-like protein n=1 Tax=Celerinatantimonas diazotrophica TaxID=412034 RepID=A0A4R1KH16_9GAMM|nr:TadE family protein [Celerinatantimonas diazotrophica]TCK64004.1 hypothetical protein EV690_0129 [Celerinatantimonas diazotrophica]CAG9297095.1 hypothetical protein CEDIAZO_02262 [Celerinatantimonas diazotrophica]